MKPDELKDIRNTLELSQSEMAAIFNVTKDSVSRWERGVLVISTLSALAFTFGEALAEIAVSRKMKGARKMKADVKKQSLALNGLMAKDLKRHRETLGLTQSQLAQLLGVHPITVSRWETGAINICQMPMIMMAMGQVARLKNNPAVEKEIRQKIERQLKLAA